MVYALLLNIVSQAQEQFIFVPFQEDKPVFVQPVYVEEAQKEFKTLEYSNTVLTELKETNFPVDLLNLE